MATPHLPTVKNSVQANSITVDANLFGVPGVPCMLVATPRQEGDTEDAVLARLHDISLRTFKVFARLARNYQISSEFSLNFTKDEGDSFFVLACDGVLSVHGDGHAFRYLTNEKGHLSFIEFECEAKSSVAARAQFHEAVAASVDHLSYAMNLPVVLAQITIIDTKHGITTAELVPPYPARQLSFSMSKIHPKLAPAYAMYREAKNAGSPFYRFFCLYKILEGLLVFLRGELYTKAKSRKIDLPKFAATVPAYEHMADELKQYVGKPMHKFFQEVLQTDFRNSLAHFVNDSGAALDVNGLLEIDRYSKVVHLTDLCCREAIAHFEICLELLDPVPLTSD